MGLADELTKLSELHRTNSLSDTEYAAAKARLIEGSPAVSLPTPVQAPLLTHQDSGVAPKWMKPWGWFLVWLGVLGFGASSYVNWRVGHEQSALITGLLNPMFFVGMPIGLYWLARSGVTLGGILTAINRYTVSDEERQRRGM